MNKEQKGFYHAQIGSPLQIAVKDNEPLRKQLEEMIEACKRMVREEIRGKINLKTTLIEELKTMYGMIELMQPKSEAEFIAVALPNLHTRLFNDLLSDKSKEELLDK